MTIDEALDIAINIIEENIKYNISLKEDDMMCYFQVGTDLTCEECGNCYRSNPNWSKDIDREIETLEDAKKNLEDIKRRKNLDRSNRVFNKTAADM